VNLQPTDWSNICANVTAIALPFFHIPFPTTVKSAILSSLFEIEAAKYYQSKGVSVKNSANDTEPDLFFQATQTSVEIKVTKLSKTIKFRGNKVSKRESQFVMIIWDEAEPDLYNTNKRLKFYVTTTYLTPSDWSGDIENYNASFLHYKDIENKVEDLVGNRTVLCEYK
jgi:hypothetical protein